MKILLVEDEAASRETLAAILGAQGHEVVAAENGAEAWGLWQIEQHRIVVADWLMPEMDGLDLCRKIRARSDAPYTYFIMETVRSGRGNFLEAMGAGVDDFITKPIFPDELLTLEGLLAICSYCKRLRDERGTWVPLENYLEGRSIAQFSHGICPDCYETRVKPLLDG